MKIPKSTHILLIALISIIVFSGSLKNDFAWDDVFLIVDNPYVKSWSYLPRIFSSHLYEGNGMQSNFYRPLQLVSFALDYSFWKLNPFGYHLTSLFLHIINSSLVYIILLAIGSSGGIAFFAAVLFSIAPVISSTTYYISARSDLLMALFLFISFLLFSKYIDTKKGWMMVLSAGFFMLSLLSKEMAFIFPALLSLELRRRRVEGQKADFRAILPYMAILVVYIIGRVSVLDFNGGTRGIVEPGFPASIPLWRRILTDFKVIPEYIELLLFPYGLHMDRFIRPAKSLLQIDIAFYGAILVAIFFFIKKISRTNKLVLFGAMWFLITLLPVLNIYPISVFFGEGWLYIPSVGFFIVLSTIYHEFAKKRLGKRLAYIMAVSFLVYYASFTILHGRVWRDSISLLQNAVLYEKRSPFVYITYNNLAGAYYKQKDYENSITYYKKSIEANPRYASPYDNLGVAYTDKGKYIKAVRCFKMAIRTDRKYLNAYCNLAHAYYNLGFKEKAVKLLTRAIEIDPDFYKPYYDLGFLYSDENETVKAMPFIRKAIELRGQDPQSHYCLGALYLKDGRFREALAEYDIALKLGFQPDHVFFNELAFLYIRTNRFQAAEKAFLRSLSLEKDQSDAHNNLANLYCLVGNFNMAMEEYRKALSIDPDSVKIRENLIKTKADWKKALKRKI